jgi:lipoate-protein ligase A
VCFDTPTKYEITVSGKKLIGSAQVRRRGVMLQHGTLPLTGDLSRILDCVRTVESSPSNLAQNRTNNPGWPRGAVQQPEALARQSDWLLARACTLEQALGWQVPFQEAANALAQGFASELNLRLEPGELTDRERLLTDQLRRDQYASDDWNRRV